MRFLASLSLMFIAACAGAPFKGEIDPREMCDPESAAIDMCRPDYVSALPLESLKQHGATLIVACDWRQVQDAAYEKECREQLSAAVENLAQRFPDELEPIAIDELKFEDGGVCIDTFIPGREAADCFDYLRIVLPLHWKTR